MGTREDLARALVEGAEAGLAGTLPTACPYQRSELTWSAWVRGYSKTARLPDEEAD